MSSVNQVNAYSGTNPKTSGTSSKSSATSALGMDAFLNLLAKEMSSQDVMNPMSNTEFISQMAQFTSLQEMSNVNKVSMTQLGASMVGKRVTVAAFDSTGKYAETSGVVTNCDYSSASPSVVVNGKYYDLSSVMEVVSDPSSSAFQYGASLVGKKVAVSAKDSAGKVTQITGTVSGCSFTSGNVTITVDGKQYDLSSVVKVVTGTDDIPASAESPNTAGDGTPEET